MVKSTGKYTIQKGRETQLNMSDQSLVVYGSTACVSEEERWSVNGMEEQSFPSMTGMGMHVVGAEVYEEPIHSSFNRERMGFIADLSLLDSHTAFLSMQMCVFSL